MMTLHLLFNNINQLIIIVMSAVAVTEAPKIQKYVRTFNDTNYFAKGTYKRDYLQIFSTSAIANIITKTVLAPLERWRIIKQTQLAYQLRPKKMASFFNYLSKVSQDQGIKSFWRGNSANCWIHFWQVFFQVYIFDTVKGLSNEYAFEFQNDPFTKSILERILAPTLAAASALVITHPIDTARIRISMNYFKKPQEMLFTGVFSCWSLIRLEERSMKGIYRGYLLATLISALNLNIYASFRDIWANFPQQKQNDLAEYFASKQSFGILCSILLLHPLDTIRKNLQLNNQSRPTLFTNALSVVKYYKNNSNLLQLYSGITITVTRQIIFWPIFTLALNAIEKSRPSF